MQTIVGRPVVSQVQPVPATETNVRAALSVSVTVIRFGASVPGGSPPR
ncbi:MAG: hypothetical protein IPG84_15395 [Betaproteobacteria bacterium]|nr:hypothetical protein [Betaproteobacteria bacterium]